MMGTEGDIAEGTWGSRDCGMNLNTVDLSSFTLFCSIFC
jgi:hypothetical protein